MHHLPHTPSPECRASRRRGGLLRKHLLLDLPPPIVLPLFKLLALAHLCGVLRAQLVRGRRTSGRRRSRGGCGLAPFLSRKWKISSVFLSASGLCCLQVVVLSWLYFSSVNLLFFPLFCRTTFFCRSIFGRKFSILQFCTVISVRA